MSIEITIVRAPGNVHNNVPSQIFTEQGGTIGRGAGNTWALEDPERFISTQHSQVTFENGYYYLADLSTNGTFYNGAREPIGSGNRVVLKDGDRFSMGDYEFLVSMRSPGASASTNDPFGPGSFAGGHAAPAPDPNLFQAGHPHNDPFAPSAGVFGSSITPMLTPGLPETDPLAALDRANRINSPTPFQAPPIHAVQRDDANALQQAMKWPSAIPENWDADESQAAVSRPVSSPLPSSPPPMQAPAVNPQQVGRLAQSEQRRAELEAENQKLLAHLAVLKNQIKELEKKSAGTGREPKAKPSASDGLLIEAMGLSKWKLSDQQKAEISQVAGQLVRESLAGLMQALSFRKKIKEEFRINVTTIQPVENNPLKFSANIEDALENMFIKDNKAYQKPLDAVREGFHGISEHQLAVLAGIQAAFRGMLERLDPGALEQRFEKYRKAGVIKVGQKGKNWDAYKEFHKDLVNNMDNSFQHLFAYDFVQAYEDQLQRLLVARKAKERSGSK